MVDVLSSFKQTSILNAGRTLNFDKSSYILIIIKITLKDIMTFTYTLLQTLYLSIKLVN